MKITNTKFNLTVTVTQNIHDHNYWYNVTYRRHRPNSEYIWHRSWSAEQQRRLLEWLQSCDKTDILYHHPSVERIPGDILCRTCGGMAKTLADGRGHQTDSDISDT